LCEPSINPLGKGIIGKIPWRRSVAPKPGKIFLALKRINPPEIISPNFRWPKICGNQNP